MVFQHFSLFDSLTVAENLILGLDENISFSKLKEQVESISLKYELPLDYDAPITNLSAGEKQRVEIVKLFSSVLSRDNNGDFWLITPVEMCRIKVEDAPFIAVELTLTEPGPKQSIKFRTNVDDWIVLDKNHPIRLDINKKTNLWKPYISLRKGIEAKLTRAVYYELIEVGVEEIINNQRAFGVWSKGHFFALSHI